MDAELILILALGGLVVIALLRLVAAIRNSWDGEIEDLYEDVVIRRLVMLGAAAAALLAAWLLRGPLRSIMAVLLG
ncbi:MAG TPA: hypothetical protein VN329_00985 [Roseomonas sp.]|nr:hypothetical protein [Roseomonas sp.]